MSSERAVRSPSPSAPSSSATNAQCRISQPLIITVLPRHQTPPMHVAPTTPSGHSDNGRGVCHRPGLDRPLGQPDVCRAKSPTATSRRDPSPIAAQITAVKESLAHLSPNRPPISRHTDKLEYRRATSKPVVRRAYEALSPENELRCADGDRMIEPPCGLWEDSTATRGDGDVANGLHCDLTSDGSPFPQAAPLSQDGTGRSVQNGPLPKNCSEPRFRTAAGGRSDRGSRQAVRS